MSTAVGALISLHLRKNDMTAADVERRVGLNKAFIGRWMNKPRGFGRAVSPDTLERMAKAIGVDLAELTFAELESCGYVLRKGTHGWPGSLAWDKTGRDLTPAERAKVLDFIAVLFPAGRGE